MLPDLTFAFRRVVRAPLFSLAVMLILGIGIGAQATTFSIVNAFFWRPLAVPDAEDLVLVEARTPEGTPRSLPLPLVGVLAADDFPAQGLCGFNFSIEPSDINGSAAMTRMMVFGGDCFSTLRTPAAVGRVFGADEAPLTGKGAAVAVLSHAFWQQAFGGGPDVIGRTVRVENGTLTIIGVLPAGFDGLNRDMTFDIVAPYNSYRQTTGNALVMGRRRAGVSARQLQSRLEPGWSTAVDAALPATITGPARQALLNTTPQVTSLRSGISTLRNLYGTTFVNLALGSAILVLLTALNVGGLLCSRLTATSTDAAVLRALGATRARLVRTICLEAAVLALGGALIGLPIALFAAPAFGSLLPFGNLPWTVSLQPDVLVIALAVATALAVAAVVACIPAWLSIRGGAFHLSSTRTVTRATTRSARVLLVVQIAATLVLVFGCSLLVRSLISLERSDRGYTASNVVSLRVTARPGGYGSFDQASYYRDLVSQVAEMPGVTSVGMARYFGTVPNERAWVNPVGWSGRQQELSTAAYEYASPRFFSTIGVPLLRGRDFTWSDAPGAPAVVLVSDSLARTLDPAGDVVGRVIRYGTEPDRQQLQIVGVVGDLSFGNSRGRDLRTVYFPGIQANQATYGTLHVRTDEPLSAVTERVREVVARLGREQVLTVNTIDGMFSSWLVEERMGAVVGTAISVLAVVIAGVGVYSLLAYAVARRTREFGIRMAVGAAARDIWRLILRDVAVLAGSGVVIGAPAAIAASRLLESLLFGVTIRDVPTLVGSALLLVTTALLAAVVPARRALRVVPAITLRAE